MPVSSRMAKSVSIAWLVLAQHVCDAGAQNVPRPHVQAAAPREWTVDAKPRLRIAMNADVDFAALISLSVLPNDGIVLASDLRNNIQFFDSRGRLTKTVGRNGQGPGEFEGVDHFFRFGDTLALIDMNDATHRFTLDGQFVRSSRVATTAEQVHGFFANGDLVVGVKRLEQIPEGRWQQATEELVRITATSRVALGRFPTQEFTRLPDGKLKGNVYSPRNRVAVLRSQFCAGFAGSSTFGCYDGSGRLLWTRALTNTSPVAVTNADKEAYFNDIYTVNVGSPRKMLDDQVRWARASATFAKSLGVYGPLLAARDNALWIGPPSTDDWRRNNPNPLPERSTRWRVYSIAGELLANVTLPPRFYLLEAGADYVAGVTKDDDDLEVVLVYSLRKQ